MTRDVPDVDPDADGVTAPPVPPEEKLVPPEENQPLLALGDPAAAVCEGDVCYLPGPGSV
jgi:hypothetical protein